MNFRIFILAIYILFCISQSSALKCYVYTCPTRDIEKNNNCTQPASTTKCESDEDCCFRHDSPYTELTSFGCHSTKGGDASNTDFCTPMKFSCKTDGCNSSGAVRLTLGFSTWLLALTAFSTSVLGLRHL